MVTAPGFSFLPPETLLSVDPDAYINRGKFLNTAENSLLSSMLHQMATVQQPRRPPPPPSPPPQASPAADPSQAQPAVTPSQQLPCKRSRAARERVADSCCPQTELVAMDDDGCGSCVDGGGGRADGGDVEVSGGVVIWWRQRQESSGTRCFVLAGGIATTEHERAGVNCDGEEDEDPKAVAARRREEDRKFWEACLASGYP